MPSLRPGGTNSLKKIDFFTPPRTCTSPGGTCTRSDFSHAIAASAGSRPWPRANGMWGRPIRRSARQGPLFGSAGSLFSARSGRKTAPAPPAVCALSAAAARLLRPEQRAATAWRAPDACQLSAAADLGRRKNVIFRLASSCCSGADMPPTPPGADMPPTTSSDREGFRRHTIAFRKPLGPHLKATSLLQPCTAIYGF